MDPLTQGAFGAAWAQSGARGSQIAPATGIGCAAGMAPDLDLLIRSGTDPLLAVELHRHFTHALAFIPFGALICALIAYPLVRRRLGPIACYAFSLLGYASHGLLDACTGYGTLLFWPFSRERVAFDIVSVIDPLFTLPVIGLVTAGLLRRHRGLALMGLVWCGAYLAFATVQHQRAASAVAELAAARGHLPERVVAKPSLGNVVLWRTIYRFEGNFYIDAVRAGRKTRIFEGDRRLAFDRERDFPGLGAGSQQSADIERFSRFADGYIAVDSRNGSRIVDLRYALVPNRADALWAIELDAGAPPDAHAAYVTMRNRAFSEGRELIRMIGDSGE